MKLPILLKSLQPEEHKEFEKFLQSPFFKASEQYLKFFRFLCKYHPSFELEKADLQTAYRRCFGQQSLSDTKLYNLMSGLGKQVEQYLVVQMVLAPDDTDGSLFDQILVNSLGKRNMGTYFRKEVQRLIAGTMKQPRKDKNDYLLLNQLHHEIYFNPDTSKIEDNSPYLILAADYLDLHYCISKLRYATEMKIRERIYPFRYEMPLLEAVMAHSAVPELLDAHPLLAITHQFVSLYSLGLNEPGFREMMTVFVDKFDLLTSPDQISMLRHLINYGVGLLSRDCAVEVELLALYKLAINTNVLLVGNRITYLSFINISSLAGLCKEFDWAESFIEQFSPNMEESKRQPTIHMAKASLYYEQGFLDEAQTWLKPEIFQIPTIDILGRGLLIKIVFDRYFLYGKDYEFLTAQIKAFERFIKAHQQLSAEKKEAQINWIKFVRKLTALKFEMVKVPESKKEPIRRSLERIQPVIHKKWLEQKLDAL